MCDRETNYLIDNLITAIEASRLHANRSAIYSRDSLVKIIKCLLNSPYNNKGIIEISDKDLLELSDSIGMPKKSLLGILTKNRFIIFKTAVKNENNKRSILYEIIL
jgi:hypothetical protein